MCVKKWHQPGSEANRSIWRNCCTWSQRPLTSQFKPGWTGLIRPVNTKFIFYLRYTDGEMFVLFHICNPVLLWSRAGSLESQLSFSATSSSADSIAEKIKIALKLFSFNSGSDALINVVWCFLSSVFRPAADERIGWGWHKRWRVNGCGCVGAPNYLAVGVSEPPCGVHKSTLWLERGGNEGPFWPHAFTDTLKRTHFSVNNSTADPGSGLVIQACHRHLSPVNLIISILETKEFALQSFRGFCNKRGADRTPNWLNTIKLFPFFDSAFTLLVLIVDSTGIGSAQLIAFSSSLYKNK